jgi:hypothetical protein
LGEQFACAPEVAVTDRVGEQPVVTNAVEAAGEHVEEEPADELVGTEGHGLVAVAAVDAVILPAEGDAALVAGDQPAVGDGDAVGIARQIGQYGFGAGKGALGIDDPLDAAKRL